MKLAWLADIHLNFLDVDSRKNFFREIIGTECDALLISGDIAEAPCLTSMLCDMVMQIKKPIYFIVGNHDYYHGRVEDVRNSLTNLTHSNKQLFWLPATGIRILNDETILLGQDGWADGRLGDKLLSLAINNTSISFIVLCGHTHSKALYQPLENLIVKVGAAEYYHPTIQEVITC